MRRALRWLGGAALLLATCGAAGLYFAPSSVTPEAIARSVDHDPERLAAAYALPTAATFPRALHWQANGSLCGPASVVNVRRSLGLDAIDEAAVLDGTGRCWTGACIPGLTLDELAEVARARGDLEVTLLRDLSPEQFREHMRASNDPDRRYIINFARGPIFGAGGGHHSPIGGYLEAEDEVLVLDVNEQFKPWLIERARLYAAMDTVDSSSEQRRGLLLVRRRDEP